jgi:hypothetical protein
MKKEKRNQYKVEIKSTRKYGKYLVPHLKKEHPKTRGKIKLVKRRKR